jgi:hypothetical protein
LILRLEDRSDDVREPPGEIFDQLGGPVRRRIIASNHLERKGRRLAEEAVKRIGDEVDVLVGGAED